MKNNQPTVALDVDGVLLDFVPAWAAYAERLLNRKITTQNPAAFSLHQKLNVSLIEADAVWDLFHKEGGWLTLPPISGAVEVVNELKRYCNVVAVTAIDLKNVAEREHNLQEHGMAMPVIAVGRLACKREALHRIKPCLFVDDMIHNLQAAPLETDKVWLNTGLEQEIHWEGVVSSHYPDLKTWWDKNPAWVSQLKLAA